MWGSVKGSVLGPHTLAHFPTPPLFLSPHPFPHTNTHSTHSFPHTNTHSLTPHSLHTLFHTPSHTSPLPTHLSLLISTPQHTSLAYCVGFSAQINTTTTTSLHSRTPPPTYLFSLPTTSLTSPYTQTHFPTNSMHSPTPLPTSSPQFGLCGEVTT